MIIAFSGHRPQKLGGFSPNPLQTKIREKIKEILVQNKPDYIISGMALGVDQWAAEIAHSLQIPFWAAIPFLGQEKVWPEESRKKYNDLLLKATNKVVVSPGEYTSWKMQKRNEWMVNHCNILVTIWDGSPGGTANCIRYAQGKNKEIIRVDPRDI